MQTSLKLAKNLLLRKSRLRFRPVGPRIPRWTLGARNGQNFLIRLAFLMLLFTITLNWEMLSMYWID